MMDNTTAIFHFNSYGDEESCHLCLRHTRAVWHWAMKNSVHVNTKPILTLQTLIIMFADLLKLKLDNDFSGLYQTHSYATNETK